MTTPSWRGVLISSAVVRSSETDMCVRVRMLNISVCRQFVIRVRFRFRNEVTDPDIRPSVTLWVRTSATHDAGLSASDKVNANFSRLATISVYLVFENVVAISDEHEITCNYRFHSMRTTVAFLQKRYIRVLVVSIIFHYLLFLMQYLMPMLIIITLLFS